MPLSVKLRESRRRTRTYDRQPGNLAEVIDATEEAIDGKADLVHKHVADDITDAGATGKDLLRVADPGAGRTVLEVESTTQLDARDTANRDRSNHTGTQLAATISDFNEAVASIISYNHTQAAASMVWTIDHNLGRWPIITTFSLNGGELHGTVTNPTLNRTTVTFNEPLSGYATLI